MQADPVLHPLPPSWPEDRHVERGFAVVLVLIAILAVALSASGCASAETRAAAHEHRVLLGAVRAASVPAPGVTPAKWSAGWDEAERGAALLETEAGQ